MTAMHRWLMKTEPGTFSIEDLERRRVEPWDGVRNYQARNFIRQMRAGDPVLIYHSACTQPGVAGIAKVASAPKADPTQFDLRSSHYDAASKPQDPRWTLVDVRFVRRLRRPITLDAIKALKGLGDYALTRRGNRLSVFPLTAHQWQLLLSLE